MLLKFFSVFFFAGGSILVGFNPADFALKKNEHTKVECFVHLFLFYFDQEFQSEEGGVQ